MNKMVKKYLGDLTESPALFPEVNDHTTASVLGFFDSLFDSKDEVRTTGANVGAKNIAPIALNSVSVMSGSRGVFSSNDITSSWTLRDRRTDSSDILAGSPKQ